VNDVRFPPGGKLLLRSLAENGAHLWAVSASATALFARVEDEVEPNAAVLRAAFSKSGKQAVTLTRESVAIWPLTLGTGGIRHALDSLSLRAGNSRPNAQSAPPSVTLAALGRDGDAVAAAYDDGTLRWLSIGEGSFDRGFPVLRGSTSVVSALAVSIGFLVAGDRDGAVWSWSGPARGGAQGTHLKAVRSVAFNRDGTSFVTASDDGTARVWPTNSLTAAEAAYPALQGSDAPLVSASFNADGTRVVTVAGDRTARIWRIAPATNIPTEWAALRAYLRAQTTACLDARQYVNLVSMSPEAAQQRHDACARRHGPKE
jgi:WD40 repeat protein